MFRSHLFSTRTSASSPPTPCPDSACTRGAHCPFAHEPGVPPLNAAVLLGFTLSSSSTKASSSERPASASASSSTTSSIKKRPAANEGVTKALARDVKVRKVSAPAPTSKTASSTASSSATTTKIKAKPVIPTLQRPSASKSSSSSRLQCPVLNYLPYQTNVPLRDRQRALQLIFEAFTTLYEDVLDLDPSIVARDALLQEDEIYKKGRTAYTNAVSNFFVAIRKRRPPNHLKHSSIGTQSQHIAALAADEAKAKTQRLTTEDIAGFVLTTAQQKTWEYIFEVPEGEGGAQPHEEGCETECGRCGSTFIVPKGGLEGLGEGDQTRCFYHWGRRRWGKEQGIRIQIGTCCGLPWTSQGCTSSRSHVFKRETPKELHRVFPFSTTAALEKAAGSVDSPKMPLVAVDCEMLYTTAGMSLGRVTIVAEDGSTLLDEFIRVSPAHVLDCNSRFSGIQPSDIASATMDLAAARRALSLFVGPSTILIGHGLENDLNALRLIHPRCIDTAILFPHSSGPPFRPALKALVSHYLERTIQTSGDEGHSSAVDAIAALDLVKWKVFGSSGG